jgi:hypothetical protein
MNRKLIYTFGLFSFFLMGGVFGFAAAAPRGEPAAQATVPPVEPTVVVPEATAAGIPVTGEREPVWAEIVVFYGLIGLTTLFLILGLLMVANRSTAPSRQHKGPPSDNAHKD